MKTNTTSFEPIIQALNLKQLSKTEQEEILLDLNELLFKGTLVRLLERMDEKTQEEFDALLSSDASEEVVEKFLKKHVPHADAAVEETITELTNDILAVTT
jgi:hypothetical protein